MKNNLLKFYLVAFFLLSDFLMFADENPDDSSGGGGSLEGDDETPISGKLFILAILGIGYAYYYISKKRQEQLLD